VESSLSSIRRILICGNSGHGKTFFSTLLRKQIDCYYFNANLLREITKDFSFSDEGRIRQAGRYPETDKLFIPPQKK